MPLDPNKLYQKKPRLEQPTLRPAVLFAIEWSAIIFAGMLAVLFLCWSLAVVSTSDTESLTAAQAPQPASNNPAIFLP